MNDSRQVVVIGSGPTGAMAALRLTQKGIPVTMLESGSHFTGGLLLRMMGQTIFRRQPDLKNGTGYTASGDARTLWFSNLSPGGLTNQWTGAVPRFAPEDFHEGARLHEKYRWPIGYDDLAPYYEIVEKCMRVTGTPQSVPNLPVSALKFHRHFPEDWKRIATQAAACGHGLAALPIADGGPWMFARRGTAFNSFTEIVNKLRNQKHFHLISGAHVLHLVWSGERKRVTEILYQSRLDASQHRIEASAVILAAGSLASTRLLLNSRCADFPNGLGNCAGVLGRYLHDHPKEWWAVDFDTPLSRLPYAAYLTRSQHSDSEPLLAAQYTLGPVNTREKVLSAIPSQGRSLGVNVFGTMRPTETNRVTLHTDTKDEQGLPILDIHIRYNDDEIANMKSAREKFLKVFDQAGFHGSIRKIVPQLQPGASVHYGGTVRMHASAEFGMLDAWNRLHEVSNVLVTDASCFTTGVEKNPTSTAMAISARAADRLAEDLRKS